jgi:predicted metal-dependent enzyme (double-stranded beta helix superfamily)
MIKLVYKPVGLLVGLLGGILAGTIFKKVWKLAAGEDEAPQATDAHRGWGEVLLAATLQGAIFALVKAVVDRGAATGVRKVTGVWPADQSEPADTAGQQTGTA